MSQAAEIVKPEITCNAKHDVAVSADARLRSALRGPVEFRSQFSCNRRTQHFARSMPNAPHGWKPYQLRLTTYMTFRLLKRSNAVTFHQSRYVRASC